MRAPSVKNRTAGCVAVALIALGACGHQGAPRTGSLHTQASALTIRTTAAVPLAASFVGLTPPRSPRSAAGRLALFSAKDGRRLRFLTAQRPGGGAYNPVVSADGRTVAFERGSGPCDQTIDAVPAKGGRERVLIPMKSSGNKPVVPSGPTYSSDGQYFAYLTTGCSWSSHDVIHVRNLRTGQVLTGPGYLPERAVFVNSDRQIVFPNGRGLVVVRLPSFARHTVQAPRGCQYQLLAGTETKLAATVECGHRHAVSIVAISTRTFTVTKTVLRLSHCPTCTDLSFAATDPSALLVATDTPCLAVRGSIYVIRGQTARIVVSRSAQRLPYEIVW